MQLTYVSGESRVCPRRSHCRIGNRPKASLWIFFIAGDGGGPGCGSDGWRWRRALDAPIMDLCVILFSFRVPGQGLGCKRSISIKSNPFSKKSFVYRAVLFYISEFPFHIL
jgi:hypothetical protein